MRGEYLATVANNRVKFKLNIRRNLTILQGNSATGKTTLLELIDQFDQLGPDSGVSVVCDAPCHVLSGRNWKRDLKEISSSIVFIDEDSAFMRSHEFAHAARESDNYYVLVARESLPQLPYSVDEIYGLKTPIGQRPSIPSTPGYTRQRTASTANNRSRGNAPSLLSWKIPTLDMNSLAPCALKAAFLA